MLHSSAQSQRPNAASVSAPKPSASHPANGLVRAAQKFWRFSKFYGEFISTPIHKRKIR